MNFTAEEIARFWDKAAIGEADECWNWQAATVRGGYGAFHVRKKSYRANRVAFFLAFSKDPGILCVCHTCDNPSCVNPSHLFLGTISDNAKDAYQKGRMCPPPNPRGERNFAAKLTRREVIEIKERLHGGYAGKIKALAHEYGVEETTIRDIKTGRSWSHIQLPEDR